MRHQLSFEWILDEAMRQLDVSQLIQHRHGRMFPNLSILDLEFTLVPLRDLAWPIERRGTILRGALGHILRSIACDQVCEGSGSCRFSADCAYGQLFSPQAGRDSKRLSKNSDRPRPFLLRPTLDRRFVIAGGDSLTFSARLFGRASVLHPYLIIVFSELFRRGLGRSRIPCQLRQVRSGKRIVFRDGTVQPIADEGKRVLSLALDCDGRRAARLDVRFLTPTALKDRGNEARTAQAAFPALVRRARDRVSSLYQFYGTGASGVDLPWDFRGIGEEAEQARCVLDHTEWRSHTRRSTRTGHTHSLDGIVGHAVYEHVPPRSAALVRLAEFTHVGKHATFGLGRIQVLDRQER